jgi:hypothetical protein
MSRMPRGGVGPPSEAIVGSKGERYHWPQIWSGPSRGEHRRRAREFFRKAREQVRQFFRFCKFGSVHVMRRPIPNDGLIVFAVFNYEVLDGSNGIRPALGLRVPIVGQLGGPIKRDLCCPIRSSFWTLRARRRRGIASW